MDDYSEFVHEYTDPADGRTRYVVARRVGDRYIAPLSPFGKWLTEADGLSGRRVEDIGGPLTFTYSHRAPAIRVAVDLYGDGNDEICPRYRW